MTPYHFSYVYVLQSMRFPRQLYVGFTNNLRKRYAEHNAGTSPSTKRYMPWRLSYYEAFSHERLARERESHLKNNGNPMRELKKRIGLVEVTKSGKGFTLIETMVAVTILTLAIAGPLYTASRAIVAAQNARDRLTASYLAQEGIEHVRWMRDNEYLAAYQAGGAAVSIAAWGNFLNGAAPDTASILQCRAPKLCTLDPVQGAASPLTSCPGNACTAPLYLLTNGVYSQQNLSGSKVTPFVRTIQAIDVSATDERIVSTVSWSYHQIPYSVTVYTHLTPWQ